MFNSKRAGLMGPLLGLLLLLPAPLLWADTRAVIDAGSAEALLRLLGSSTAAGSWWIRPRCPGVSRCREDGVWGWAASTEGSLLVPGKPTSWLVTAGPSFGLQVGVQTKAEVILFMTDEA